MRLQGAIPGKKFKTTIPDHTVSRPADLVDRDFSAPPAESVVGGGPDLRGNLARLLPEARWVAGLRMVLDALEQALDDRPVRKEGDSVHHSDRGVTSRRCGRRDERVPRPEEAKAWLGDYTDPSGCRPYAHPYYWSAFVLLGESGQVVHFTHTVTHRARRCVALAKRATEA